MDYNTWSRYEAVPLSSGIVARRTGLHYMKSPEEISAYYLERFGRFWFNELPKTDNTYCATSKYYGCTLAPGIPLIPNLCRRPLRSPSNGEYDYSFNPIVFAPNDDDIFTAKANNHHNSWVEKNNVINNGTSTNHNHMGQTQLQRRRLDYHDSGLDSDSDFEDSHLHYSQNTVTWLSWIITTITTVVTIVKETITTVVTSVKESIVGRQDSQNHVNTRVPLKQSEGVSWYQYPVLWLYMLGLWVHRADVWVLHKVNSVLKVDSWGTPQQRRKWALILLLIPLILWAGLFIAECSFPSSETVDKFFNISRWESAVFSPIDVMT